MAVGTCRSIRTGKDSEVLVESVAREEDGLRFESRCEYNRWVELDRLNSNHAPHVGTMAQYDRDNLSGGQGYRSWGSDGGSRGRGRGGSRSRSGLGYQKSYSDEVREEVEELFGKKFRFKDEHDQWILPEADTMFQEEPFEVNRLLKLKEQLNATKAKLDDKEVISWHKHTNFSNRAGIIISAVRRDYNPEMCTQGWLKFHEILSQYASLVPESATKLHSMHLCEAPGGFVASLNHFLKTHRSDCEWSWRAMTLNPYYEGVLQLCIYTCMFTTSTYCMDRW